MATKIRRAPENERTSTPEERAAQRVKDYTDLMWHIAAYVIVNAFLWLTVSYAAFWTTLGWGIGLGFHVAHYYIGRKGTDNRRYQKFLAEERARDLQDSG